MDEYGVSQYASETLTLESCDKQVDLSSLSTEKLFSAHELLHSLAQNSNTTEDPFKAWTYILLSWLFENKHNNSDPFEITAKAYADFGYPEEASALDRYMPTTEESAKSEEQSVLNGKTFEQL